MTTSLSTWNSSDTDGADNSRKRTVRARDRPGRRFYDICYNEDGTVDIFLSPYVRTYYTEDGFKEYDLRVLLVRGVEYYPGLEEDIRAHYYDWCDIAEEIDL